jgi:hypothetical protein
LTRPERAGYTAQAMTLTLRTLSLGLILVLPGLPGASAT